jgi:hypothetical protein
MLQRDKEFEINNKQLSATKNNVEKELSAGGNTKNENENREVDE